VTESSILKESKIVEGGLTIGVTTRNRMTSLHRCLESLRGLAPLLREIIVVDDTSTPAVEEVFGPQLLEGLPVRVIRHASNEGNIVGRNRIVRESQTEHVLLLDDDAAILDARAVWTALEILQADDQIAAIAFAQGNADGSPWPREMQPAAVSYPCQVPAFIGFAHLLRRSLFLSLGAYHEIFHYYGEEKDFTLRVLDAGYRVIYLPQCVVAHLTDPAGRDLVRYYRHYIRNDCLGALYSLPWPVALIVIGARVWSYHTNAHRHLRLSDPNGRRWLLAELRSAWPQIRPDRRPVRYRTLLRWRRLRQQPPPYPLPLAPHPDVTAHS
jgi:GT2 family glycosyltransferase